MSDSASEISMSCEEDLKSVLSGKIEVFHGTSSNFDPRMMHDAGIGFWFAQNEAWARGYAERSSARSGNSPRVLSANIVMRNPLYAGNLDDAATDCVLKDLAEASGVDVGLLKDLRNNAGWSGAELDEPAVFEIVNRSEFFDHIRRSTFDGVVAFEDGGEEPVFCVLDRKCITFKLPKGRVGVVDVGKCDRVTCRAVFASYSTGNGYE